MSQIQMIHLADRVMTKKSLSQSLHWKLLTHSLGTEISKSQHLFGDDWEKYLDSEIQYYASKVKSYWHELLGNCSGLETPEHVKYLHDNLSYAQGVCKMVGNPPLHLFVTEEPKGDLIWSWMKDNGFGKMLEVPIVPNVTLIDVDVTPIVR